ncbi:hypothetical protein [Streptomyces tauricus]|uniref:hypothetical protein n=1 Tax=Streptomyces tauricus TaxID=68274 RepID=UPI00344995BF
MNRPPEFHLPEFPQQEFPESTATPADRQTRPAPETAQDRTDRVTEVAAVPYKRREVGRRVLEGELPEPIWYS